MVTFVHEITDKDLSQYCVIFIGGGNTFKLLYELKISGAFEKIKSYIENDIAFNSFLSDINYICSILEKMQKIEEKEELS